MFTQYKYILHVLCIYKLVEVHRLKNKTTNQKIPHKYIYKDHVILLTLVYGFHNMLGQTLSK